MIGIDIVDLAAAAEASNWQRPGYLAKIFTPAEQAMISHAVNPNHAVWLFWSMKESAYKIHSRKLGIRNFAPTKLGCTLEAFTETMAAGRVTIDNCCYCCKSEINSNYVLTLAAPSAAQLLTIINISYCEPHWLANYHATQPKSVSHHGRYLALAY